MNIGITDEARQEIAAGLSRVLADSYTLYLKTHNYHWNVVGPQFHSLHAMFMEQYTELSLAVDEIAERIRAIGMHAPGSYREFAALTSISEDEDHPNADNMVRRLVTAHETTARTIREVLPVVQNGNDNVSEDLLITRLQVHEKTAWMLRSMIA